MPSRTGLQITRARCWHSPSPLTTESSPRRELTAWDTASGRKISSRTDRRELYSGRAHGPHGGGPWRRINVFSYGEGPIVVSPDGARLAVSMHAVEQRSYGDAPPAQAPLSGL